MLTKILIAIAAVLVVLIIVIALQPSTFRIARSATISAPPSAVFEQVNELRKWEAWSPFVKMDPSMKLTYEGPQAGLGASQTWVGNNQVGEGRMTITESRPSELVQFRLDFIKPFAGTNTAEFTFKPEGGQTVVTWSMSGQKNFVCKAFGLVMNMDKMCGGEFEKGLAAMKTIVEGQSKPASAVTAN